MDEIEFREYTDSDGRPRITVVTPKFKGPLEIYKAPNGYSQFLIKHKNVVGDLPLGAFTTLNKAKRAVTQYINAKQVSTAVSRDAYAEKRANAKAVNAKT